MNNKEFSARVFKAYRLSEETRIHKGELPIDYRSFVIGFVAGLAEE